MRNFYWSTLFSHIIFITSISITDCLEKLTEEGSPWGSWVGAPTEILVACRPSVTPVDHKTYDKHLMAMIGGIQHRPTGVMSLIPGWYWVY